MGLLCCKTLISQHVPIALEADAARHMELFPEDYTVTALQQQQQQSNLGTRALNMVSFPLVVVIGHGYSMASNPTSYSSTLPPVIPTDQSSRLPLMSQGAAAQTHAGYTPLDVGLGGLALLPDGGGSGP